MFLLGYWSLSASTLSGGLSVHQPYSPHDPGHELPDHDPVLLLRRLLEAAGIRNDENDYYKIPGNSDETWRDSVRSSLADTLAKLEALVRSLRGEEREVTQLYTYAVCAHVCVLWPHVAARLDAKARCAAAAVRDVAITDSQTARCCRNHQAPPHGGG